MSRVPRWGVHDGIKFNQKRTLIRFCGVCGQPYPVVKNVQKYCSDGCKTISKRDKDKIHHANHNPTRDLDELREKQAIRDSQTSYGKKKRSREVKIDMSNPDEIDWDKVALATQREKRNIGL